MENKEALKYWIGFKSEIPDLMAANSNEINIKMFAEQLAACECAIAAIEKQIEIENK